MSAVLRPLLITGLVIALSAAVSSPGSTAGEESRSPASRVAGANDVTVEVARELLADPTVRVDEKHRVYFVDPAAAGPRRPFAPETSGATADRRSLTLHSKPGADRVIFLDFDGTDVSGTGWNTLGVANGFHEGWDPSGNGPSFDASELAAIDSIFQRVAEDFAPFDVDVTTEEPPAADITRSSGSDQRYGTRVLISDSDNARFNACSTPCGGVAYLNAFNRTPDHASHQPAWVFAEAQFDDVKNIAEAASHEAGHNLGLLHDGQGAAEYYGGHNGWAPIMGTGYSDPVTQWSAGEYAAATNTEDDFAVMESRGLPRRADEAGDTIGTPALVLPSGPAYISDDDDVDFYALGRCSGNVIIAANAHSIAPNLDIELSLFSGAGLLETANPTSGSGGRDVPFGMNASINRTVQPANHWLRIDGVGRGTASTGYTDYGSVGSYELTVTGCTGTTIPGPVAGLSATRIGNTRRAEVTWSAPTFDGGTPVTEYQVLVNGGLVATTRTPGAIVRVGSARARVTVTAANVLGRNSGTTTGVGPRASKTSRPRGVKAFSGRRGGRTTAGVRWRAPASNGGARVLRYRVVALKLRNGRFAQRYFRTTGPQSRRLARRLPPGRYVFRIQARNKAGWSRLSKTSNRVRSR